MSIAEVEAQELALEGATGGLWHDALRRLVRNPAAILGGVLVSLFITAAIFAPVLLFAIGIVAMLGPGLFQIMIAVGVVNIPIFARLLRGSILAQRENDFVLAARSVGVRRHNILFSHILPNAISPVIVQGTLAMATAIIDVAGLGFLGVGPPD